MTKTIRPIYVEPEDYFSKEDWDFLNGTDKKKTAKKKTEQKKSKKTK